jgi:hypothetical protein
MSDPPDDAGQPVARHTHRVVGQHEDQLVEHQDPEHRLLGDADLRRELRQEDHVDRPAQREEELHDAEVEADAARSGRTHGRQAYGKFARYHSGATPIRRVAAFSGRGEIPHRR